MRLEERGTLGYDFLITRVEKALGNRRGRLALEGTALSVLADREEATERFSPGPARKLQAHSPRLNSLRMLCHRPRGVGSFCAFHSRTTSSILLA